MASPSLNDHAAGAAHRIRRKSRDEPSRIHQPFTTDEHHQRTVVAPTTSGVEVVKRGA